MKNFYAGFPSDETMKKCCHSASNQDLLWQSIAIQVVLSLAFFLPCAIPATILKFLSLLVGLQSEGESLAPFQNWLIDIAFFSCIAAALILALTIFARIYLHSHFGPPASYGEIQIDLPQSTVLAMSTAFLMENTVQETFSSDPGRGRLIGLMRESDVSATFLEITYLQMEAERTWISFRAASLVRGKARLLSAFYNDFGAAGQAVNRALDLFSPYGSRKPRPFQGSKRSKSAIPVIELKDDCPPPLSIAQGKLYTRVGQFKTYLP